MLYGEVCNVSVLLICPLYIPKCVYTQLCAKLILIVFIASHLYTGKSSFALTFAELNSHQCLFSKAYHVGVILCTVIAACDVHNSACPPTELEEMPVVRMENEKLESDKPVLSGGCQESVNCDSFSSTRRGVCCVVWFSFT